MFSKSRSSSAPSDARACQPKGSPACSHVRECHGPAHTVKRYVEIGGVVVKDHVEPSCDSSRPLPSTVHSGGALTVIVIGALRSGWSKQAKTRCARSIPAYAATYTASSAGS